MDVTAVREGLIKKLTQLFALLENRHQFLNAFTEMIADIFGVCWVSLYLFDEDSKLYALKAFSRREKNTAAPIARGTIENAVSWLAGRQRSLSQRLLDEIGTQMAAQLRDELSRPDTFASMPLFLDKQLIGVLNLGARIDRQCFSKEDLELLTEMAQLFAVILKQAVYHHQIAEQRIHHQNILDNLVSGIVAVDPEDKITVFNRAAERILRFKAEDILGKNVRMLASNISSLLLATLHQGQPYRREEVRVLPENVLIGVSTSQFYDAKGRLLGACMVFSNLERIKQQEQLSRQQNQDIYWSNVAKSLAHEVKNSIVATKIYTELFPQKYEDAEFRWNLYSTLKRDMSKLDNFTETVLSFAQSQHLFIQSCHIDNVVDAALESLLQETGAGNINVERTYSQDLHPLTGDYHQLKDAFSQIISNALEAMGKQGSLVISIAEEVNPNMLIYDLPEAVNQLPAGQLVVVKISDTGCGILSEHMSHLFEPFFTTKEGRTGLGLASARKIVEKHHGVIVARSKPNAGSTFWICLPVSAQMSNEIDRHTT